MRKMTFWLSVVILAGVVYLAWPTPAVTPMQNALPVAAVKAEPVPFLIRSKTRQIIAEWKKLAASRSEGDREASQVKIRLALDAIRQRLQADGAFGESALRDAMLAAARELGHGGEQAVYLIGAALDSAGAIARSGPAPGGALGQLISSATGLSASSGEQEPEASRGKEPER